MSIDVPSSAPNQNPGANPSPASNSYHHGNLRQELLRCAEEHLKRNGIAKLSLRALARDIGVSQTAPYRHFEDKDALLAALATEGFERLFSVVGPSIANAHADPQEALFELGMTYVRFAGEHTEVFRLMFGPGLQPRNQYPELFKAGREAIYTVRKLIERVYASDQLSSEEITARAQTCWAGVHGVATLTLDHADSFGYRMDTEEQAAASLRFLISAFNSYARAA